MWTIPGRTRARLLIDDLVKAGVVNNSAQHVDIVTDFRAGGCGRTVHVDGIELVPRDGVWEVAG